MHQSQRSRHAEKCIKAKPNKVELVSKIYDNTYTCKAFNKIEPQSAHFNKDQYTLLCTAAHSFDQDAFNKYIYHSYANVDDLMINNDQCLIFSFKFDNCTQQYKSPFVFANWKALAKKYNKTIILYYGVSGHGKGLVDSMSCFGIKGPLQKSIIAENFFSMM